jgi:hypothetical protein
MKVVDEGISGVINIAPILPVVDTRHFQALDERRQLGMTYLTFRDARHSRLMHSLGSYEATRKFANRLILEGSINAQEGAAVAMFALVHDIGHGPFSHTTEDFCLQDHHATTLDLIRHELRSPIQSCGVDADMVIDMASRTHPLHKVVSDRNLGMEKLDYLRRDGLSTVRSQPPGIDYLQQFVYFIDGQLMIDKKIVDHVLDVMNFYMKMYKGVYLRKSVLIAQRMLHKATYHLIASGGLEPTNIPQLTDPEFLGVMAASQDPIVKDMYLRIRERRLFKEGLVIRTLSSKPETRVGGKPIKVIGVTEEEMRSISKAPGLQKNNHAGLEQLEISIAHELKLRDDDILVVPVFYPERFVAEDVHILGGTGHVRSLRDRRPDHFKAMEETARSYTALRICAPNEYREVLSDKRTAPTVVDIVSSFV